MSFNVYLSRPSCEHCHQGGEDVYSFNLTHNVNNIVDACLLSWGDARGKASGDIYERRSWGRLAGWKASDAVPVLERALREANDLGRSRELRLMEPANGWGSLDSVRDVLAEFLKACRENPDAVISVSG